MLLLLDLLRSSIALNHLTEPQKEIVRSCFFLVILLADPERQKIEFGDLSRPATGSACCNLSTILSILKVTLTEVNASDHRFIAK